MEEHDGNAELLFNLTRRELLVGAAAGAVGLGLAVQPAAARGKPVDSITWAMNDDPVSIDYAFSYDFNTAVPVPNVTETIVRLSPTGRIVPNLAVSWHQPSPLRFVYRIRRGVKFHDGSEMTADDVAFSMARHLDPKVGSYLGAFYERVKAVKATGPYEVTVEFKQPDALWQFAAATMAGAVAKKAFLEQNGKKVGKPGVGIVGTGPYRFVSWTPGQQVVLERFDDYWNKARRPAVRRFVAKVIHDEATIVQALGTGEIDGNLFMSGKSFKAASRLDSIRIVSTPSYNVRFLGLNVLHKPFDDRLVRQAMSHALDVEGVRQSVGGGDGFADRVLSPAPPPLWSYEHDMFASAYRKLPRFPHDVTKAKALLQQAGFKGSTSSLIFSSDEEEQLALAVQAAGHDIGIQWKLEKLPYAQFTDRLSRRPKKRPYDAYIGGWSSDIPDPAGNLEIPFSSRNWLGNLVNYHDPKVDRDLARQRELRDDGTRARLLIDAQARIVPDQAWVIFYSPRALMAINKRLGGYKFRPLWYWDTWLADVGGV